MRAEFFYFTVPGTPSTNTHCTTRQPILPFMSASDQPTSTRFERDFRLIRESHNMSLEELSRATHITLDVLYQFEETGLINHPRFNTVYLKAMVRTVADALGVPANDAIQALEEAMEGRYAGRLQTYVGAKPAPEVSGKKSPKVTPKPVMEPAPKPVVEAAPVEPAPAPETKPKDTKPSGKKAGKAAPAPETKPKEGAKPEKAPDETPKPVETTSEQSEKVEAKAEEAPKETEKSIEKITQTSDEAAPEIADKPDEMPIATEPEPTSASDAAPEEAEPRKEPSTAERAVKPIVFDDTAYSRTERPRSATPTPAKKPFNFSKLLIPLAIVGIIGVIIWFAVTEIMSNPDVNPPQEQVETPPQPSTPTANNKPSTPDAGLASALPDSFMVQFIAINTKISGLKVTPDSTTRFPVWIEQGDTLRARQKTPIYVKQKLTLEGVDVKNVRVLINGKSFIVPGADSLQSVVLTREKIAQLLNQ